MAPRRTYVVSLYDADNSIVVEAVQRDERARIDDLDSLAARIREWEAAPRLTPGVDSPGKPHRSRTTHRQ
jgi:hypothetical protein